MGFVPELIETPSSKHLPNLAQAFDQNFSALAAGIAGLIDYGRTGLTGGGENDLDGIDGADLSGGEIAIVVSGSDPSLWYFYHLVADKGGAESSPDLIAPDQNAGDKRWVLGGWLKRPHQGAAEPTANDDETQGFRLGDLWLYEGEWWVCSDASTGAAVWLKLGKSTTVANIGGGIGFFKQETAAGERQLKTLASAQFEENADLVSIKSSVLGEANTGASLGDGLAIYKTKSGVELQFRSLDTDQFEEDADLASIKAGAILPGHVILAHITTPESNPPADHAAVYPKSDNKLYILDSSGTETEVGSVDVSADVQRNTKNIQGLILRLAMLESISAGDMADGAYDAYNDESGIDTGASIASYDADGDFYEAIPEATGQTTDQAVDALTDVSRKDLKGTIAYWQNTSTAKGYFSSDEAGTNRISITAAGTEDEVIEGVRVEYSGGAKHIVDILNDGDQDDEVTLDSDLADATAITGIYGLEIADTDLTVSCAGDYDGANNTSEVYATSAMTSDTTPSPNVISYSDTMTGDWAVWHAFDQAATTGGCFNSAASVGDPNELKFSFGSGNSKACNKLRLRTIDMTAGSRGFPKDFTVWGGDHTTALGSDTGWTLLKTVTSYNGSDPGQAAWGAWVTWVNGTAYEAYRIKVTSEWDSYGYTGIGETHLVETQDAAIPTDLYCAITESAAQIDCSGWSDLNSATVSETTPGSAVAYYALAWDYTGASGDAFVVRADDGASGYEWRSIARNNSGTWEYNDGAAGAESWSSASVNAALGALYDAWATATNKALNQMGKTIVDGITDDGWNDTGGWSDAVNTIDLAVGLKADGADIPAFDKVQWNFDQPGQDLVLISQPSTALSTPTKACGTVLVKNYHSSIKLYYADKTNPSSGDYTELTGLTEVAAWGNGLKQYACDDVAIAGSGDDEPRYKIIADKDQGVEIHGCTINWG